MNAPTFGYPGGKAKLRDWLISMFPSGGRTYIEPFTGRGNVFFAATQRLAFRSWWLNDIFTARFLRAIITVDLADIPLWIPREQSVRLARRVDASDATDVETLLGVYTQFSGGVSSSGSSPMNCARYRGITYRERIKVARRYLDRQCVRITDYDWRRIPWALMSSEDFAYVDPPYVNNRAGYFVNMPDENSHRELLTHLQKQACRWILSGYDTPLYRSLLGAPAATTTVSRTMSFAGCRNDNQPIECVWSNYPLANGR